MGKSKKIDGFIKSIINMAADKGMSEEEFTSAIDTARKIIRRNPISKECLSRNNSSDMQIIPESSYTMQDLIDTEEMDETTLIYDRIKELCKEKGVSVSYVEKEAGLGNGSISKWNKSSPTVDSLQAVAQILEVKIDKLIV